MNTMTKEDVSKWITNIGLSEYCKSFIDLGVDGGTLGLVDDNVLREDLKISKLLHRKKILVEIDNLKKSPQAPNVPYKEEHNKFPKESKEESKKEIKKEIKKESKQNTPPPYMPIRPEYIPNNVDLLNWIYTSIKRNGLYLYFLDSNKSEIYNYNIDICTEFTTTIRLKENIFGYGGCLPYQNARLRAVTA